MGLRIGNVELENPYILAPMAGGNRPAISFVMQRTGRRTFVYGNGKRSGHSV